MAHTCNNTFNRASIICGSYLGFLSPPNFINTAKICSAEWWRVSTKLKGLYKFLIYRNTVFLYKPVFQASVVTSPATSNLAVTGIGQTRLEQKVKYKRKLQGMDHFAWFFFFLCISLNYSSVDGFRLIMNNICYSIFFRTTFIC